MSALETVQNYIAMRQAGAGYEEALAAFFTKDGVLVDAYGTSYSGKNELMRYYKENPGTTADNLTEPVVQKDGRLMLTFTVRKLFMDWPIRVYFEISKENSPLFTKVVIECV